VTLRRFQHLQDFHCLRDLHGWHRKANEVKKNGEGGEEESQEGDRGKIT